MSLTGSGQRAYIGSFTSAGGRGITTAAVDPDSGALTVLHTSDAVADPSYLLVAGPAAAGGPLLHTVSEVAAGGVATLSLADPDRPALVGAVAPVDGRAPTHLARVAGHLLTANYSSGSVSVLPLRADGTPAAPSAVLRHEGGGPHPDRQKGPHAHAVLPDPSGRWVLSVDLGTDSVRVCALDAESGALRVHHETRLRPGSGPRHLAFHPRGDRAYVINELDSTVTACRWDAAAGMLEPIGESRVLPEEAESTEAPNHPSELVLSRDGRFVWVANRGHDSIAVLALDPSGDGMELVTTVDCGGRGPRDLTLDPAGRRLYAANERSGDVTWFDLDERTGVPRRAGSIEAPAVSCVAFG
ncbi:lactonase family protein [Streptomyces sp. H27-D2]|uniref:lactonase family protein n=1 Tax=Streptomyces sp. H27-D2 TaxID=3046304 RepID=UPI002DBF42CF|nr:lactonase family protein [Streptomyces sp. H27-D2]MEC4021100.1 lactonase family protein [Streptomyces sp. H27-D2]